MRYHGTDNALKRLGWQKITNPNAIQSSESSITYCSLVGVLFIQLRLARVHFMKIISEFWRIFNDFCDIEAIINSHPLTCVSDDSNKLIPLTHSVFLQNIKQVGVPDLHTIPINWMCVRIMAILCDKSWEIISTRFSHTCSDGFLKPWT